MKGLMFDLDGTLVDTLEDIAEACNALLHPQGYPTHAIPAYRNFVGRGFTVLVRRALPSDVQLSPEELEGLVASARLFYSTTFLHKSNPYPFIHSSLYDLCKKGMRLAVLSNKPDQWTKAIVQHFFGDIPFCEVRGALPDVPLKPAPEAAFAVLRSMGLTPAECLYVGDSDVDMQTAANAGMRSIGVSWGFSSGEEVAAAGAWRMVTDARQLLPLAEE